jgi:LPS-assembly protein
MNIFCAAMIHLFARLPLQARVRWAGYSVLALLATGSLAKLGAQQPEIPPELQSPQTTVSIRADSQEKDHNVYHVRGHVEVTYRDMKLTADEASFDEANGNVRARGHVTFADSESQLEADEAFYNVQTDTGWFSNGRGTLQAKITPRPRMLITENPFYIRARRLERQSETTYVAVHAHVTSCDCEETGWSISARRARVEVGNKVVTRDSFFRLLRVPVFYFPVTVNSIASKPRQTGFLLPHIGNSSQKGFIVGGGFFWAINPSADLQLGVENYSIRGLARNGVFRARPTATSQLLVEYSGINDKGSGPQRRSRAPGQSLRVTGDAKDLGKGFRGVINVDYITSLAYRLIFTNTFSEAVTSEVHQTGFATKNFGAYSLNFFASRYQNFLSAKLVPGNSVIIRQTPSADFSGMDRQVGNTPFYFAFDFSAGAVGRTEPGLITPQLSERVDFHPEVTLRSKPFLGFHVTPSLGLRATHYGTSLRDPDQPLNRLLGEFSVDLRPPSFEKVFSKPHWGYRFKHVIEPEIRYDLVRANDGDILRDVVRYDQFDIFAETNEVEYSLTNSLLVRKEVSEGEDKPQARELISWRLSQKYYFDPTFGGALDPGDRVVLDPTISLTGFAFAQGRRLSPVVSVLKFAPFSNYDTELRADFDPAGGGVLNAGISSSVRRGPLGLSFTDFFINKTAALSTPLAPVSSAATVPSYHLLRAVARYGNVNRKGLSAAFGLNFNFAQRIAHQVVSQVSYNFGCFALDFEYQRFALGALRRENEIRIALSLANIGSFGNLKPRERLY